MLFGIDVIIVAPGPVKTPIWSKAQEVDISPYRNSPYFPALQGSGNSCCNSAKSDYPPEDRGDDTQALTSASPKVRYQIMPEPMQHSWSPCCQAHGRQDHRQTSRPDAAAGMTTGKSRAELTELAGEALRSQPGCETAAACTGLQVLPNIREGRNWEIPNVMLGDSLISDVDRAVISVHRQLGRKYHLLEDA